MVEALLVIVARLAAAALLLLIVLVTRRPPVDAAALRAPLDRLDGLDRAMRDENERNRRESGEASHRLRGEVATALQGFGTQFSESLRMVSGEQQKQIDQMRLTVEGRLKQMLEDNAKRLEEMRKTVDEKLQATLNERLGASFKRVDDQLQQVHTGLGEMQVLATGVGDLKKVLANVKIRGTWGEVQLGGLLDQMLAPEQFETNVATRRGSADRVEFAVRLPGQSPDEGCWLPIDAKFPMEDYQRLVDASEAGDPVAVDAAHKAIEVRIKGCAKDIHDKYVDPPHTTSFALLYLPIEGLYAEVVRVPGLVDVVQREYHVTVAGPSTLAALLTALQMGFRTLAIQKRSEEIWKVLGAVKAEFGKFGDVLAKLKKNLETAANTVEATEARTRVIGKKLKGVETLADAEAVEVLGAPLLEAPEADTDDA